MRVQLVKPKPAATEPASTAGSEAPPASVTTPVVSREDALLRRLTSWTVVLPALLLCFSAVSWSLLVRLPGTRGLLTAHARTPQEFIPAGPPIKPQELSDLSNRVHTATAALVQKRDDLGPLLFDLETAARRLGWRVDVSLKPAVAKPGGLKDVTLYPVTFRLADEAERSEPAYQRLLQWLRVVSSQPTRTELVALRLRAAGAGLSAVEADLQLFSIKSHEEAAPK